MKNLFRDLLTVENFIFIIFIEPILKEIENDPNSHELALWQKTEQFPEKKLYMHMIKRWHRLNGKLSSKIELIPLWQEKQFPKNNEKIARKIFE